MAVMCQQMGLAVPGQDVREGKELTSGLCRSGEDGRVHLAKEQDTGRHLHVLAHLEILRKVHAVLYRIVTIALDHHVCDGFAWPGIPGNELGDDVEEAIFHPPKVSQKSI